MSFFRSLLVALLAAVVSTFALSQSAGAMTTEVAQVQGSSSSTAVKSVTKKCTSKWRGQSVPYFEVDSMFVTRTKSGNKWKYTVNTSKKRGVSYVPRGGTGANRIMYHTPAYVKMYRDIYHLPKTVKNKSSMTFTSQYAYNDFVASFKLKDGMVSKNTSCIVKF